MTHTTKKALLASVLSVIVCFSMLIGSTFAWFTDTASTSVNTIQSGKLDVALEMSKDGGTTWENAEGKSLDFLKSKDAPAEEILWEPGCTYQLPMLRVVNNGNLWLKYEIAITGINGDAKLNEVIEWSYTGVAKGALAPNNMESFIISGHMSEEADNDYMDLSIDGISITVYATQYTYENDSFDNQYDAGADLPLLYQEGNLTGATEGKHLVGNGSSVITSTYQVYGNTVENYIIDAGVGNVACASQVKGDSTFNNCTFIAEGTSRAFWADDVEEGATITFNNCTFKSAIKLGGNETNKYIFNNCHFEGIVDWAKGLITAYSPTVLNNCTFDYSAGAKYSVYKSVGLSTDIIDVKGSTVAFIAGKETTTSPLYVEIKTAEGITMSDIEVIAAGLVFDKANTYTVLSAEGMFNFAKQVNESGKTFEGATVKLADDIDLANEAWTPIGQTGATEFKGVFDGNGKTIKNLFVDSSAQTGNNYSSGLFGWIESHGSGITIKNVTVEGAVVKGNHNVAVIAGRIGGDALIDKCKVIDAQVVCAHANDEACGDKAGTITGIATDGGKVTNCTAENSTVKAGRDAGQIVGSGITGNCTVENCGATDVTVSDIGGCTGKNIRNEVIGRITA